MPIKPLLNRLSRVGPIALFIDSFRRWSDKRASSKGAALALYMVFSLAPILLLVIALSGWFFGEEAIQAEILFRVESLAGERSAEAIRSIMANAHYSSGGLIAALVSFGLLVFSSTTAFAELKNSLDEIWDVDGRSGLRHTALSRILSFGVVLVLAAVLFASVLIDAVITVLQKHWTIFFTEESFALLAKGLSSLFSFTVFVMLMAFVLRTLPSAVLRWRDVLPGAILTSLLFFAGKTAIATYLASGTVVSSYGAAGSVIALILWIYFSALIFFFGAAFTREYWERYGTGRELLQNQHSNENRRAQAE